jgi:hypothetical protein
LKGNEFKIILTDINEKLNTLIEGQRLFNKTLDRHIDEDKKEFKEVRKGPLILKKDILELRKGLNEHRENTELHVIKKKKKAS